MIRELDAECARALGWEDVRHMPEANKKAQWTGRNPRTNRRHAMIPHYSSDHAAARLLEDEIERRQIDARYTLVLGKMVAPDDEAWTNANVFLLLRATPEQRARAFLESIK